MLKVQNTLPLMTNQPSFQKSSYKEDSQKIKQVADALEYFDGEDADLETGAGIVADLIDVSKSPKPLKYLFTALGIGFTTFVGAKLATGRGISLVDKHLKVFDKVGEHVVNLTEKASKKVAGMQTTGDKGVKAIFRNGCEKFLNIAKRSSEKGVNAKALDEFVAAANETGLKNPEQVFKAKNAIKRALTNTAAGVMGLFSVSKASKDTDGNGIADIVQDDQRTKSLVKQVIATGAGYMADVIPPELPLPL